MVLWENVSYDVYGTLSMEAIDRPTEKRRHTCLSKALLPLNTTKQEPNIPRILVWNFEI